MYCVKMVGRRGPAGLRRGLAGRTSTSLSLTRWVWAALACGLLLVAVTSPASATPDSPARRDPQVTQVSEPRGSPGPARSSSRAAHARVRRQNGQVVESIFQVPIQTLSAVSNVFKTSIQAFQRQRENFVQATGGGGNRPSSSLYGYLPPARPARPAYSSSAYSSSSAFAGFNRGGSSASSAASVSSPRYQSGAAAVAGVPVREDGSSFRI